MNQPFMGTPPIFCRHNLLDTNQALKAHKENGARDSPCADIGQACCKSPQGAACSQCPCRRSKSEAVVSDSYFSDTAISAICIGHFKVRSFPSFQETCGEMQWTLEDLAVKETQKIWGFPSSWGYPFIAGWFISWKYYRSKWMMTGGTPQSSIFHWIFHCKPTSYGGTPMYGTPPYSCQFKFPQELGRSLPRDSGGEPWK